MAHKYEHVSTGGGFSVLNSGVKTEVIAQDGTIKGDIKEALAQGSIYIGNSSGVTSELSIKGDAKLLIGNGTTATSVSMSGDATIANTGALTIANDAIDKNKLDYEVVAVTVSSGASTGTGTATADGVIIGILPAGNQDQFVDNVELTDTTVTVTLAGKATADNVFNVVLLKA